jgi:small subunit ribosomal protein S16e
MSATKEHKEVQTFGRKKNATAVARVTEGSGFIRVNGRSLNILEPASMRMKVFEPILLLGANRFKDLNIRCRVRGGGSTSQVMAIRQAIAKGVLSFAQKYDDETTRREMKELLLQYDKGLLVADPRRCEPKKFGGKGARARFQKSYR